MTETWAFSHGQKYRESFGNFFLLYLAIVVILLSQCFFSSLAHADVYRFVDDQGIVNYVDSITKVPARFHVQLLTADEKAALEGNKDSGAVLLFLYELVDNELVKKGLWEDAHGKRISAAKAVTFYPHKASINKVARYKIHYDAKKTGGKEGESLVVYKVNVSANDFIDLHGRPIKFNELSGFMLKSRIP